MWKRQVKVQGCCHHGSWWARDSYLCYRDCPELREAKLWPAAELLQTTRALENWLQEGVRNRLVRQIVVGEFLWETYCGLKDLANVPLFSELTYIHSTKTSSLLYFSSFFEFFLIICVEVSNFNNCTLKLLWIIYLLDVFFHKGRHVHFLLELRVKSEI